MLTPSSTSSTDRDLFAVRIRSPRVALGSHPADDARRRSSTSPPATDTVLKERRHNRPSQPHPHMPLTRLSICTAGLLLALLPAVTLAVSANSWRPSDRRTLTMRLGVFWPRRVCSCRVESRRVRRRRPPRPGDALALHWPR